MDEVHHIAQSFFLCALSFTLIHIHIDLVATVSFAIGYFFLSWPQTFIKSSNIISCLNVKMM